jgi:hypothetical protein
MNDNSVSAAQAGFIVGMILMLVLGLIFEPAWIQPARKAKEECELNIPRKETCVLVALPRSKD